MLVDIIKTNLLTEELHIDGAEFLGNAFGYDVYNIKTYAAAQEFIVADKTPEKKAGEGWTSNESTFNAHINDTVKLIFMAREGTNEVFMGVLTGISNRLNIKDVNREPVKLRTNCTFESAVALDGERNRILRSVVLPLFLIPGFECQDAPFGMCIDDGHAIKLTYKGFLNPRELPSEVTIPTNVNWIEENAFTEYPVPLVVIPQNVTTIEEKAFYNYDGMIEVEIENTENVSWSSRWTNAPENKIIWGCDLSPEETARRREETRLAAERAAARARRAEEIRNAEILSVLRYKQEGKEITILGCKKSRTKLDIPAEIDGRPVTKIAAFAFYRNLDLKEVVLPDTIKLIEKAAFYGCSNLILLSYPSTAIVSTDAFTGVSSYATRKRT